jgi:hypothetical protein
MQLTAILFISVVISASLKYILIPRLMRIKHTPIYKTAGILSWICNIVLGVSFVSLLFFVFFQLLFVLKLGPVGWIKEWSRFDMVGAFTDVFSLRSLSKMIYFILGLCILLYLVSYIFILSFIFGTINGIVNNEMYKFYLPPYGYGVQVVYPETPYEWVRNGLLFGTVYLLFYMAIYFGVRYGNNGTDDPFYIIAIGWIIPMLFYAFSAITYVAEKIRGSWY